MQAWRGWLIVLAIAVFVSMVSVYGLNSYQQQITFYFAVNIMLAVSLNLVTGFCGQFSLGHAGFMAVGAYASALLSLNWQPFSGALQILNFPLYAIIGGLAAAAAGFLVGMPSLRLRGDYLAIVTLGFGEIIRVVLLNLNVVGGARGLGGIPGATDLPATIHAFLWASGTVLLISRLVHSSYGRAFLSVREDEIAAECMGINTTSIKVKAFVISSFFAGAAGSIFAHAANFLNPATFQFNKSVDFVIMIVLGGMGSISGSVIGAIVVTILPEALRSAQHATDWILHKVSFGYIEQSVDLRMVIYSLLLIVLMIWRPAGLLGSRELGTFWKRWRRAART